MLQKIVQFLINLFMGRSVTGGLEKPKSEPPEFKESKVKQVGETSTTPEPPPEPIVFNPPTTTLYLGVYDSNVNQSDIENLLKQFHIHMGGVRPEIKETKIRHGDLHKWIDLKKLEGTPVMTLQKFLSKAGFLPPYLPLTGIFDYGTQSAVRLFQEYVRTVEGKPEIGLPDGVIGKNGWKHIKRWTENRLTASEWQRGKPSAEYKKWITMLANAKSYYTQNEHFILDKVDTMVDKVASTDTLKKADWETGSDQIHLIGIRRKQELQEGSKRKNDDLFILLINGLVFKFWGSTDPQHSSVKKRAFLVEGQHKFAFGWHMHSTENKIYQGLNPYKHGVLIYRDWNKDGKLTEADIEGVGISKHPNTTINIHWTGAGKGASGTWSEGCQVFAGESYINHKGDLVKSAINGKSFAAIGTRELRNNASAVSVSKTMGAYNVFADLLLLFRPQGVDYLYYTLGRDETFDHKFAADVEGMQMISDTLSVFQLPPEV